MEEALIAQRWVGKPVPRKEDEALLTGRARFIDDLSRAGPGGRGPGADAGLVCVHLRKPQVRALGRVTGGIGAPGGCLVCIEG